jgi:hypothetical protein
MLNLINFIEFVDKLPHVNYKFKIYWVKIDLQYINKVIPKRVIVDCDSFFLIINQKLWFPYYLGNYPKFNIFTSIAEIPQKILK